MTAISRADLDLEAMYAAFAAAVGEYACPCGSTYAFGTYDTLADYAALNRWLGRHYDDCPDLFLAILDAADADDCVALELPARDAGEAIPPAEPPLAGL